MSENQARDSRMKTRRRRKRRKETSTRCEVLGAGCKMFSETEDATRKRELRGSAMSSESLDCLQSQHCSAAAATCCSGWAREKKMCCAQSADYSAGSLSSSVGTSVRDARELSTNGKNCANEERRRQRKVEGEEDHRRTSLSARLRSLRFFRMQKLLTQLTAERNLFLWRAVELRSFVHLRPFVLPPFLFRALFLLYISPDQLFIIHLLNKNSADSRAHLCRCRAQEIGNVSSFQIAISSCRNTTSAACRQESSERLANTGFASLIRDDALRLAHSARSLKLAARATLA